MDRGPEAESLGDLGHVVYGPHETLLVLQTGG
jgi:hypothetical protein